MPEEIEGISFETLFFQELLAINDALGLGYTVSYWKTSNDTEVDFVLYGDKGIKAFEIKRTGKVKPSMLKGLKSFLRDYAMAKAYLIYGGQNYRREGNIEILPMSETFKHLPDILAR